MGGKMPEIETFESINQFAKANTIDTTFVLYVDKKYFEKNNEIRQSFPLSVPRTRIYNRKGNMLLVPSINTNCNSAIPGLSENPKLSSYAEDTVAKNNIFNLLNYFSAKSKNTKTIDSLIKDANYIITVNWTKYSFKPIKLKYKELEEFMSAHPNEGLVVLYLNYDFRKDFDLNEKK